MSDELGPARWQTALVVGLGQSGLAAARLLLRLGIEVRGWDRRDDVSDLPEGVAPWLGRDAIPHDAIEGVELVVVSPGVPPARWDTAVRSVSPAPVVVGELGLALALIHARVHGNVPWRVVPTVLVTGTNGKSTVTALTAELLRAGSMDAFAGSNLGEPLCGLLHDVEIGAKPWPDALVLECSSFQLETIPPVPVDVAMVLNVTPDHLDRYPSMDVYATTKARVFTGLGPGGLALVDAEDAYAKHMRPSDPSTRCIAVGSDTLRIEDDGRQLRVATETFPRAAVRLAGRHNAKNALFALAAARHLGITRDACLTGLRGFSGLPHRMVFVRELDNVAYFDDSKATNVASVLASLDGFERPFVLIAGGRAKGDDISPLRELLRAQGRGLVAIGESAHQFAALTQDVVPTNIASSMEQAVVVARALARPGDAIVLSPACGSHDWFTSYAHRGQAFADAVLALR